MGSFWRRLCQDVLLAEAFLCVLVNVVLLQLCWSKKMRGTWKAYRVAISISAVQGIFTGICTATAQWTQIFADQMFINIAYGPIIALPRSVQRFVIPLNTAAIYGIWELIPAPVLLQYLAISSRRQMSNSRRMLIAYGFSAFLAVITQIFCGEYIPRSDAFESKLNATAIRVQRLDPLHDDYQVFGVAFFPDEINPGKNLMMMAFCGIFPTYILAYSAFVFAVSHSRRTLSSTGSQMSTRTRDFQKQFIKMQIIQGAIPFAGINVPMGIFIVALLTSINVGNWTLVLTFTLFIMPAVQASVYLYFVRSSIRSRTQGINGASSRNISVTVVTVLK